jgi:NAD(P)-dependent dehydrogenase (short-subunit alcohol dehydrogenase family)
MCDADSEQSRELCGLSAARCNSSSLPEFQSWIEEEKVRLAGKVALITGAGMGIGRATALLFAREGAQVAVADNDAATGKETVALIHQEGGDATFVQADVSLPEQVRAMVQETIRAYGKIDILHNNAGIDLPQATNVLATDIDDWDRILDINLRGVFLCSKQTLPELIKSGGGVIINTASIAGLVPMQQEAAYGASKAGLILLAKQMARDYAEHRVRVNNVCPGPMENPMHHRLNYLQADQAAFAKRQSFSDQVPLGRMCLPEDIAQAVLFLASDDASMITGADLVVDGGFTLG